MIKQVATLYHFGVNNIQARLDVTVREDGTFAKKGTSFDIRDATPNKSKQKLRQLDRDWVIQNIPSSIWWFTEIHHNWEDGGRMYLESHNQHVIKTREERNGKNGRE